MNKKCEYCDFNSKNDVVNHNLYCGKAFDVWASKVLIYLQLISDGSVEIHVVNKSDMNLAGGSQPIKHCPFCGRIFIKKVEINRVEVNRNE